MSGGLGGREVASFECTAKSEATGLARLFLGLIALLAILASWLGKGPNAVFVILVMAAIVSLLGPILAAFSHGARSICKITEEGISLSPLDRKTGRPRSIKWGNLSRFSARSLDDRTTGRIYLYPRGVLGSLRRIIIQPLRMEEYQRLYQMVSSRVGPF